MAERFLRVYHGPGEYGEAVADTCTSENQNMVTTTVAEILPLLADAAERRRTWVRDFGDDPISISSDLYDLLRAYQYFNRPGA